MVPGIVARVPALALADLEVGDVLLFQCPDRDWAKEYEYHAPSLPAGYHLDTDLCLHELISVLDGSPYTHAALVVTVAPRAETNVTAEHIMLVDSDDDGVASTSLSELGWLYGKNPIHVLAPKVGLPRRGLVASWASVLAEGGLEYPMDDMIAVAGLLTIRTNTQHLPGRLRRQRFQALRRTAADIVVLKKTKRMARRKRRKKGWMCAALVAECFRLARADLEAPDRQPSKKPQAPDCLKNLDPGLGKVAKAALQGAPGQLFTVDDRVRYTFRFAGLLLKRMWDNIYPKPAPPPGTSTSWHLPLISTFATAHDLEYSPSLGARGDIPDGWWAPPSPASGSSPHMSAPAGNSPTPGPQAPGEGAARNAGRDFT